MLALIPGFKKPVFILAYIFLVIFLFRSPTLLNDYYDTDELNRSICATEILNGGKLYVDCVDQQPPLVYYYFALNFLLFGERNLYAVHFMSILIIIATAFLLYKIISLIRRDKEAGYLAALLYGVYITAFEESFMATNGELLFNLPVVWAIYLYLRYLYSESQSYRQLILVGFAAFLAFFFKQHGVFVLGALCLHSVIVLPIVQKKLSLRRHILTAFLMGFSFLLFCAIAFLIIYWQGYLSEFIEWVFAFGVTYSKYGQASVWDITQKLLFRQFQLTVVQIGAWLLFAWFVIRLFKDKYQNARDQEKALLLTLVFIFSYIPILLGGYRLWFHYFIQYLPALVLIAAYQFSLSKDWILSKARWTLKLSVYGPLLFFIGWHSYDIYKKYYVDNPLTPTNYNYLVERPELKAVTAWIRENSSPEDSIFVWGYSPQIYYFSQRRMGGRFLSLSHITLDNSNLDKKTGGLSQYRKTRSGEDLDRLFKLLLKDFKNKKPKYIIDTSGTSLTDYKKDSPDNYPIVDYYLKENYKQVKEISGVIILEREDYFLETAFQ